MVGNGPSLATVDLTRLHSDVTIAMNSIHHHPSVGDWTPTYYCRAEPGGAYGTEVKATSIRELTKGLDCEAYFFPLDARSLIEERNLLPRSRTHYFKSIVDLTEWPIESRDIDLADGVPFVGNTAQFAMLLALYIGANPIILLGMDHDFLAHRAVNRHFYEPAASDIGGTDDLRTYSYKSMMESTLREWERYEVIDRMARRKGVAILNATEHTFLDVFPSISLRELLITSNRPESEHLRKCRVNARSAALVPQETE